VFDGNLEGIICIHTYMNHIIYTATVTTQLSILFISVIQERVEVLAAEQRSAQTIQTSPNMSQSFSYNL